MTVYLCGTDLFGAQYLAFGATALLVFFAGTAGARIVAADFGGAADDLLYRLVVAGSSHAGLFQLATFLALEGFFNFIY